MKRSPASHDAHDTWLFFPWSSSGLQKGMGRIRLFTSSSSLSYILDISSTDINQPNHVPYEPLMNQFDELMATYDLLIFSVSNSMVQIDQDKGN